jgi:hypothetical protein
VTVNDEKLPVIDDRTESDLLVEPQSVTVRVEARALRPMLGGLQIWALARCPSQRSPPSALVS